MTDAEYVSSKERVKAVIDRWTRCTGLGWWQDVTFTHYRTTAEMAEASGVELTDVERFVAGRTTVDWRYKIATIRLNHAILENNSDEELEYIVVHEICHIIVNEMREWKDATNPINHEERVCTELSMIMRWVREAGREDERKARESATEQVDTGKSAVAAAG